MPEGLQCTLGSLSERVVSWIEWSIGKHPEYLAQDNQTPPIESQNPTSTKHAYKDPASCHAGLQEVSRCRTRGESEE